MVADKKFELGDYVEVKDRIAIFYELYPQGRLVTGKVWTEMGPDGTPRVWAKAKAYRTPEDPLPGKGTSWMALPGTTPYTRGSEVENTETSAWGRAIASLGILIDRSIASNQEVQNKAGGKRDEPLVVKPDLNGGVIGKLVAQGTQDFALRQTPDGHVLPFRVKEGNKSQIVIAHDAMAIALDAVRDTALDARVTVFGTFSDETLVKAGRTIEYQVLHLTRILGPGFVIPAGEEAPTEPLFTDDDMAAVDAELVSA